MKLKHQLTALALGLSAISSFAQVTVGVSFDAYQEERWKTDEAAIKAELAKSGAKYIMSDAGASTEKQLTDIDGLIAKGAKVLIVLARDKDAILPAINKAKQLNIPVIAYDRLVDAPGVTYITFNNKEVGRMTARAILAVKPKGNFAIIKGDPGDANANFLREGQGEVLADAIKKGDVKIVGEEFTSGWNPQNAQKNMEQILTKNGNKIDAVVAQNDGMAGGVIAALAAKGLAGIPVSGQDGDLAALNRVALGTQTVSVWKNSRDLGAAAAKAAVELGSGKAVAGAEDFNDNGKMKNTLKSLLLKPIPVTRDNLDVVVKAGHISKEALCKGVTDPKVAACK
ncbi:MAG: D-xylose transporter substrate-binding protein [Pseudomonadota bacterium]|jgi:D-xylose transport system substrate-binding protein